MLKVKHIANKGTAEAEILLYDNIGEDPWFGGGISSKAFALALKEAAGEPLTLRINSGGGSVFEGAAMYNMLRQYPAAVTVMVDGIAASIASVIAMAGSSIQMGEASWFMIHNAWTFCVGNAAELRKTADTLDTLGEELVAAYERKTKRSAAEISNLMADETWMGPAQAIELGFADSMFEQTKAAAWSSFDRFGYRHVPEPVAKVRASVNVQAGIASMEAALARRGLTARSA